MTAPADVLLVRRAAAREIRALVAVVRREALQAGLTYGLEPSGQLEDLLVTGCAAEDRLLDLAQYLADETFSLADPEAVVPYADVHAPSLRPTR